MHQGILICYWRYTIGAKARVMLKDVEYKKAISPATGCCTACRWVSVMFCTDGNNFGALPPEAARLYS
jgi:hypothetical protein